MYAWHRSGPVPVFHKLGMEAQQGRTRCKEASLLQLHGKPLCSILSMLVCHGAPGRAVRLSCSLLGASRRLCPVRLHELLGWMIVTRRGRGGLPQVETGLSCSFRTGKIWVRCKWSCGWARHHLRQDQGKPVQARRPRESPRHRHGA